MCDILHTLGSCCGDCDREENYMYYSQCSNCERDYDEDDLARCEGEGCRNELCESCIEIIRAEVPGAAKSGVVLCYSCAEKENENEDAGT